VLIAKYHRKEQVQENETSRACSTNGEKRNAYGILVKKPEGKRQFGRCTRKGNIKIHLREIGWGGMDWIELAQKGYQWRDVLKMIMNIQVE
jgi:hypothetical protein